MTPVNDRTQPGTVRDHDVPQFRHTVMAAMFGLREHVFTARRFNQYSEPEDRRKRRCTLCGAPGTTYGPDLRDWNLDVRLCSACIESPIPDHVETYLRRVFAGSRVMVETELELLNAEIKEVHRRYTGLIEEWHALQPLLLEP